MKNLQREDVAVEGRVVDTTTPEGMNASPVECEDLAGMVSAPEAKDAGEKVIQNPDVAEDRLPGVSGSTTETAASGEEIEVVKVIARSLEELPVDSIRHFDSIPDFAIPTDARQPIIARTPEGNFCIEGWSLIEAAQAAGETTIHCEVDDLNTHSDEELCLQKAGIRSLTRGGIFSYAEMLRNTRDLLIMLLNSQEDLRIHSHGRGEGFVGNREDDARHVLSMRLGKDRDTINTYLCHGEHLTTDLLQSFIERKAPKDFFVKEQSRKRVELKNCISKNFSRGRIDKAISQFMSEAFEEYLAAKEAQKNGRKRNRAAAAETPDVESASETVATGDITTNDGNDGENGEQEERSATGEAASTGPGLDHHDEPLTTDTIKRQALEVAQRIAADLSKDISLAEMKRRLLEEVRVITGILSRIESLSNTEK